MQVITRLGMWIRMVSLIYPEYDIPVDMMINYMSEFEEYYTNNKGILEYEY